jgi:hypothetical protein
MNLKEKKYFEIRKYIGKIILEVLQVKMFTQDDIFNSITNSFDFNSGWYDLYPGYIKPFDENEETMFSTKEKAEQFANETADFFESIPNPIPIFRALRANSIEDIELEYPGESWSLYRKNAIAFGSHNGSNYLLSAFIQKQFVDWQETLNRFILFSMGGDGDDEMEIVVEDETEIKNIKIEEIKWKERINEEFDAHNVFYHGSTDKNLFGKNGIHVGTKLAATQALEARIGVPAEGEWDGTREYGKTLLAGKQTLTKPGNRWKSTGFNCCGVPEEDYYPPQREERAEYSDGTSIPFDSKPIVFPVKIVGKMTNSPYNPYTDSKANSMILRNIKMGNAKSGYYYINDGEDAGSISAVIPDKSFLQII